MSILGKFTQFYIGEKFIGHIRNIGNFTRTAELVDVTPYGTNISEYLVKKKNNSELTIILKSNTNSLLDLEYAYLKNFAETFELRFPDEKVFRFNAYVTNITYQVPIDGAYQYEVSLQPTGRAKLVSHKVNVYYEANGGEGTMVDPKNPYKTGDTVTVYKNAFNPPSIYKKFLHWNTNPDGTGTVYKPDDTFVIDVLDVSLNAIWDFIAYFTIQYDPNGGKGTVTDPKSYGMGESAYLEDSTFTPPHDSDFDYWCENKEGSGEKFLPHQKITMLKNYMLYAIWKAIVWCKMEYDSNGAEGKTTDKNSPYKKGSKVVVLGCQSKKDGYQFIHWNTEKDDSGQIYSPNDTFDIQKDTLLYAIYKILYRVVYHANGGSGETIDPKSPYLTGSLVKLIPCTFTAPDGKKFKCWEHQITKKQYNVGDEFRISDHQHFNAIWAKSCKMEYNANGGSGETIDTKSPYFENDNVEVLDSFFAPKGADYEFNHWNTKKDDKGTKRKPHDIFTIKGNTTLYAIWSKIPKYTMSYNANGGSGKMSDPNSPYKRDSEVEVLECKYKPKSGNQIFANWLDKSTGTAYMPGERFKIAKNTTLHAIWRDKLKYTVQYWPNGGQGSVTDPKSPYNEGSTVTILENKFKRDSDEFSHWNTLYDDTGDVHNPGDKVTIDENINLYAIWKESGTFRMYYNANGGAGHMTDQTMYHKGDVVTVLPCEFISASGIFSHWNTQPDGTGNDYKPGDTFVATKSVVFYAMWQHYLYTVDFENINESEGGYLIDKAISCRQWPENIDGYVTYKQESPLTYEQEVITWDNSKEDLSRFGKIYLNSFYVINGSLENEITVSMSQIHTFDLKYSKTLELKPYETKIYENPQWSEYSYIYACFEETVNPLKHCLSTVVCTIPCTGVMGRTFTDIHGFVTIPDCDFTPPSVPKHPELELEFLIWQDKNHKVYLPNFEYELKANLVLYPVWRFKNSQWEK